MQYFLYQPDALTMPLLNQLIDRFRLTPICDLNTAAEHSVAPDEADYFLVPAFFFLVEGADEAYQALLPMLPFFRRFPERHVFFDMIDSDRVPEPIRNSVVFKVSATRGNRCRGGFYPVTDTLQTRLRHGYIRPIESATADVSFQGSLATHPVRSGIPDAIEDCQRHHLSVRYALMDRYFYDIPREQRLEMVKPFYRTIEESRFVLCPRGGGLNSHRFFEVMAMGRIPVLISDDLVLPLEGVVPWDDLIVRVPEADVANTARYILRFVEDHDIVKAGHEIDRIYQNFFAEGSINKFMTAGLTRLVM